MATYKPVIQTSGKPLIQRGLVQSGIATKITTGLGLQPKGGVTEGGALVGTGLKPGSGISREKFIATLRTKKDPNQLPERSSDSWLRTRDRAVQRGDYDRVSELDAVPHAERSTWKPSLPRKPKKS